MKKNEELAVTTPDLSLETVKRTTATSSAVATCLFSLERIRAGRQAGKSMVPWWSMPRTALYYGLLNSNRAALLKTATLTNKDMLSPVTGHSNNDNLRTLLQKIAMQSTLFATADTALLSYLSNIKTWCHLHHSATKPEKFYNKIALAGVGLTPRWFKNCFNAQGYLVAVDYTTPAIRALLTPYMPNRPFADTTDRLLASLISAFTFGVPANACDVVISTSLNRTCITAEGVKALSLKTVIGEIASRHQLPWIGFTKGLGLNACSTAIAYFIMTSMGALFDNQDKSKPSKNTSSLFAAHAQTTPTLLENTAPAPPSHSSPSN